jgi:hypothetical protein
MKYAWRTVVGLVLLAFERVRGPRWVTEIRESDQALGCLKGFTIQGYEIAIYCHRKTYRVQYKHWYIPDRWLFTYKVFSVVTNDAPLSLRKACELDLELPSLVSTRSFNSEIRQAQVMAYLDLLDQRLSSHPKPTWT